MTWESPDRRTILKSIPAGVFSALAATTATASNSNPTPSSTDRIGPLLIEKDEDSGFNFPYYLYSPSNVREKPLLVEPVNSGPCNDDFQTDLDAAEELVLSGVPRQISDELRIPLIVPVFANPCSGGFWNTFIQTLDTGTMNIDSGRFERIDLQLLAMVDDARQRLASGVVDLPEEIMMNGFSATGNFVNNFAVLHPERVASITAGAINGMATLPREQVRGQTINYQIGVNDIETLTGSSFNKEAWQEVPQLCYMGEAERSPNDDTLPYRDIWSQEQARVARSVYGNNMQSERMVYSEAIYHEADAPGRFEVYDNTGHSYSDRIVNDVISFHRHHNEIESGTFTETPAGGMDHVSLDVLVTPDNAETLVARVLVNNSDVTVEPVPVRPNVPNDLTIELTEPLTVDDTVTVAVFESGDNQLSEARLTLESRVNAEARFATEPKAENTTVEVSCALSEAFGSSAVLSLVPAGSGRFWQRRIRLKTLTPGDSGTDTFELETSNEGIPIEPGDEVELWLIPEGHQVPERAIAIDTVNVENEGSETATGQLQASTCDEDLNHDAVNVEFAQRPTVGDSTVDIEYTVDSSFGQRAHVRLFPETGGGQWGEGLDFIEAGRSGVKTYDIPSNLLTVGEPVEVRAFPGDWRTLDDAIATNCAIVAGIEFVNPPLTGDSEVVIRYAYPEQIAGEGHVDLMINDSVVSTIEGIQPGTFERRTIYIDDIAGGVDVSAQLRVPDGDSIDTAGLTTRPDEYVSLDIPDTPTQFDQSLAVEYELSANHDVERFSMLRLYTESSSSWGILLDQVHPGDSATETLEISADEPGVPFRQGDEIEIALVDWDDPYAIRPLAKTTVTVADAEREEAENRINPQVQRFDTNDLDGIQFEELLNAIDAYTTGQEIGGEPVAFRDILTLIGTFSSDS